MAVRRAVCVDMCQFRRTILTYETHKLLFSRADAHPTQKRKRQAWHSRERDHSPRRRGLSEQAGVVNMDAIKQLPSGKVCGVYKITSPSGKFYIGSSVDIRKRWNEHRCRLSGATGGHHNQYLQNAANKYGLENLTFEVVELCERQDVRATEQRLIDSLKPEYNLSNKVETLLADLWMRPDFRAKNSARASEQNRRNWANPEYREKAKGRVLSMQTPEVKALAAQRKAAAMAASPEMQKKRSETFIKTLKRLHSDPDFSKRHSLRMKALMTERCKDVEFRKRRDAAAAEANKKPIRCITTGDVFPSKNEAAEALGISVSLISKQLRGLPTRTGLQWEFLNGK